MQRGLWSAADVPERLAVVSWTTSAYVSFGALLDVPDARLVERPDLLGTGFSLADLFAACFITYSTYCGVSVENTHTSVIGCSGSTRASAIARPGAKCRALSGSAGSASFAKGILRKFRRQRFDGQLPPQHPLRSAPVVLEQAGLCSVITARDTGAEPRSRG